VRDQVSVGYQARDHCVEVGGYSVPIPVDERCAKPQSSKLVA
jgi:hypothetical protein